MFNIFFDEYAKQLEKMSLPFIVTCHRSGDEHLFQDNASFDKATQGFGWADSSYIYTCGKIFVAPTGLDAILIYYRVKSKKGKGAALSQRGVDLFVIAGGKFVDRVQAGQFMTLVKDKGAVNSEPHDGTHDQIPARGENYDIKLATINTDGGIRTRHIINWSGRHSDETSQCAILLNRPRYTVLNRVVIEDGGKTYSFTDHEIAQLEAVIAECKGIAYHILPVIIDAAQYKYGDLTEEIWKLIAGSMGMSVSDAQNQKQEHDDWWEGYARMHDGENPNE